MLFKRISRNTGETVFLVVKNVSGSTASAGAAVVFDVGASADGVRVTQCNAADLGAFAGVLDQETPNNGYGLAQCYGFRTTAYIQSSTGSSAAGDNLNTVADFWALTPVATVATGAGYGFLCAAVAGSSSSRYLTTAKVFIKAM